MTNIHIEGWHTDPFGLHDARWLSAGEPTKLVRDGATEFYEPVPALAPSFAARPISDHELPGDGLDLCRSDQVVRSQRAAINRAGTSILVLTHT